MKISSFRFRAIGAIIFIVLFITTVSEVAMPSQKDVLKTAKKDSTSLKNKVRDSIDKGLKFFNAQQDPKGYWSQPQYPALTALVLTSYMGDPSGAYKTNTKPFINKGYDFILQCVKPDGGIYVSDVNDLNTLANYNTAVCMMALQVANNPSYEKTLLNARKFIVGMQYDSSKGKGGESQFDGGIGYGDDYKHSDVSNTMYALESMYYTQYLKQDSNEAAEFKELNMPAVIKFIERCQNLPGYNDQSWASDDPQNKGGFIYSPGDGEHAGEMKLPSGKVALRSYGSITYSGLLSYIYAQMDKNDPRVKAAYDWLRKNYTLKENPGMGPQGMFYYYHTMAKALSLYGVDEIVTGKGQKVNWRKDLALKLLNLQNKDGSWANENNRWWEKDPVLVTAYSVITLEIIYKGL